MNKYIGVIDSGIGGISILKYLIKELPDEDYYYFGDSLNNPYGEKTAEELFELSSNIIDYLNNFGVKLVVVACNTLSTTIINSLRGKYPDIIFVGVAPPIKEAIANNYKNTLVLATPNTCKSDVVRKIITESKNINQNIYLFPCKTLANLIDENNNEEIIKYLKLNLIKYIGHIDSIVLGCTHYYFIKDKLKELFGNIKIFDSGTSVANETKRQLVNNKLLKKVKNSSIINIDNSDKTKIKRAKELLYK